jgi:hypothetical protein
VVIGHKRDDVETRRTTPASFERDTDSLDFPFKASSYIGRVLRALD